jgi:hypothetical protein
MARGRAIELDATVEAEPPPEESGGENAASLFDATADARVRILRRDDTTQKYVTHGYFAPDVGEETVSKTLGGGAYRAQLVIPDPASGMLKIKRTRDFKIPGPYKPPNTINTFEMVGEHAPANGGAPAANGVAAVAGIPAGDDLMSVLKAGIISTLLDMMKANKEVVRAPQTDPMLLEMLRQQSVMQGEMMKLILAIATKEAPKVDSESKDYLGMLAKMKEIIAPSAASGGGSPVEMFTTMLDAFKSFREAADDVVTPAASTDPLLGSIPKIAEVLYEQHQMQKGAIAARGATVTHSPTPGPAGGVAQMPTVHEMPQPPMWRRILRQQAHRLIASAVANHDPEVIAGTAILFAPADVLTALKEFFHRDNSEDIYADVLAEIPAMAEHREWLAAFVEAAQFRLFPEEFGDDEPQVVEGEVVTEGEEAKTGDA